MKKLNDLIQNMGPDKVMHFLVGMVIVAQFDRYGWEIGAVGLFVNLAIQASKEKCLDEEADFGDTAAGFAGGIVELFLSGMQYALM